MPFVLDEAQSTQSFLVDVARGHFSNVTPIHKFGFNAEIDNSTEPETVWSAGGLYPWASLDTAQTIYCLSDDAGDTMDLIIEGLDADYNMLTETVTLTGTTAVTTTNQFKRVFRMMAGGNAGTITARTTSGSGTVVAQIDEGKGQTLMAVYTIPAGYYGLLLSIDVAVQKNKDAQVQVFTRGEGEDFLVKHLAEVHESAYQYLFNCPMKIEEKTDIEVRAAEVENNNTRVSANFDLLLIKTD